MKSKAIETAYKGYRFRSRLEARWAVFLDFLGVAWGYEVEGFELGKAGRYLPDFWLTDNGYWLEVKPLDAARTAFESGVLNKPSSLVVATGRPAIVVFGDPYAVLAEGYSVAVRFDVSESGGGLAADSGVVPFVCPAHDRVDFTLGLGGQTIVDKEWEAIPCCWAHYPDKDRRPVSLSVVIAALEARRARFEFGEKG